MPSQSSIPYSLLTGESAHFPVLPFPPAPSDPIKVSLAGKRARIMALLPMNLRLESPDGSGGEEYRIRGGEVEVRPVGRSSGYSRPGDDDWQPLSPGELAEHVERDTVVAQWLKHRIGWRRLLLKCTDRDTLEKFGVAQNVSDRFAA